MSLSSPRVDSPVRKHFKLRASTGDVVYYDKSQGKEIEVALPFRAIVLDILSGVAGFHEPSNSGIWSNEVRSSTRDVLRVRTKLGALAEGPYTEIRDKVKSLGGKFSNIVYVAYREDSEWALGKVTLVGASVSAWFDFSQGKRLSTDPGVAVTGFTAQKKGRTEYFVPTFEQWSVSENDLATATALDRDLQEYLSVALTRVAVEDGASRSAPEPVQQPPAQLYAEPPF